MWDALIFFIYKVFKALKNFRLRSLEILIYVKKKIPNVETKLLIERITLYYILIFCVIETEITNLM